MRKILVMFVCAIFALPAFAAGENVATSKAFVDTAVALKQDKIPANSGTTQVLTNTGTAGNVGTKNVYDSTATYSDQTDALVDAATMNAAVQSAINAEFQCIEYNSAGECMLVNISVLPNEYSRLQYLEGTGTQYIDPNIYATNETGISVRYAFTGVRAYNYVFGSFLPHYYLGMISSAADAAASYGADAGSVISSIPIESVQIGEIYNFNMNLFNSGKVEFVGIPDTLQLLPNRIFSAKAKMFIVGGNIVVGGGNSWGWTATGGLVRLYDIQITQGNQLVRNLIPARRKTDGELGMYDTVNNVFYTNAGTDKFIAGEFMPSVN